MYYREIYFFMKGLDFPIFKTKIEGQNQKFRLEEPAERRNYFDFKAGPEIEKLRDYLRSNTFVGILLGKKNSGKGTYSKLFMEAVGAEHIAHISVGDIVRDTHKEISNPEKKIDQIGRKAIFIDGFPRDLDQISYSLYFRSLIGYREDPDFFTFISLPESIIDERMRYRVVCPKCQTPRNLKLLRTKEVGYDEEKKEFYLFCDNPLCGQARMVAKEGDNLGIEAIRDRIEIDDEVMRSLLTLEGVPKIYLRNAIPVEKAKDFVDDYELTPAYSYERVNGEVKVIEKPWVVKDDDGVPSYSLLPQAVAVSLIKQMVSVLGL